MGRRKYYRHFSEGLPISQGQVIKFQQRQAGNSHTYLLQALIHHTAKATPDFAMFTVLNPTTYVATSSDAASANLVLLEGDTLFVKDQRIEIENTNNILLQYNTLFDADLFSCIKATIAFVTGENTLKEYHLFNRFQEKLQGIFKPSLHLATTYEIEFLNVPDDFSGFIKVVNATTFENLRTDYPTASFSSVEVEMTYPAGITVSTTYDTGSSFLNDPADGDYFYLEYSRTGGGDLNIIKHPINTVPNGI